MRLGGRQILYASTNHGWAYGWTFYQMLAEALARANDVVYVDTPLSLARGLARVSARAERPRLRVLRMPTLPLQKTHSLRTAAAKLTAALTARWARRAGFTPDLVWTYTPYELQLARRFPQAQVVYWTGDEVVIPGEEALLERVDAVLCVSDPVFERHRARHGDKAHFVPVACDFERYAAAAGETPPELAELPRPIAGFSGFVNERVDVELLSDVAATLPGTLVVVGPVQVDVGDLAARTNVRLLGAQPAQRVPALIAGLDVALLPLRDNEFNRNANPVKFYEYLALGKPVVATDVASTLRRFAHVASLGGRDTFIERVLAAAKAPDANAAARVEVAREHSFDALLRRLEAIPL